MRKLPFKRALVLSSHTDDMEFGCGATVHRLIRQGCEVHSAVFSICEESVPDGLPKDVLLQEMHQAAKVIGIDQKKIISFRYPVRKFPAHRQEILEDLVRLGKEIQPDLVLTHCSGDVHQDHQVMYRESVRAFRYLNLWGYELPWNNISFTASGMIEVEPENITAKADAIACYKSQGFRHYARHEFFESHARLRGIQNRSEFAEAFEIIRVSL